MRYSALRPALLLAAGMLFTAATLPARADSLQQLTPPAPMPSFKLNGLNGSSASDADLRNKVTVIRFWASW
jgi:hypothetical protein